MQAVRDNQLIQRRRRQARWLTAIGLALLVGALVGSNVMVGAAPEWTPVYILGSYAFLIVGFLCFNKGLQGLAKWSRRPRQDEVIDNHLKNLNDRFSVAHYVTLGGRLFDHIVVHPGGVTVLLGRDSFGPISYANGRWRKQAGVASRLFNLTGPALGNPHAEATRAADDLREHLHGQGLPVAVDAAIVFVNPRATLTVDESPIPIVRVEALAGLLREKAASNQLQGSQRLQVARLAQAGLGEPEPMPAKAGKGKGRRGNPTAARPRR